MSAGRIIAAVGPVSVTVIGASTTALSVGTILVAAGGAVALGLAGYGVYRWLSHKNAPQQLVGGVPVGQLPDSDIKQLK